MINIRSSSLFLPVVIANRCATNSPQHHPAVPQEKNRQPRSVDFSANRSAADTASAQETSGSNVSSQITQPLNGKPSVSEGRPDTFPSSVSRLRVISAAQQTDSGPPIDAVEAIFSSDSSGASDGRLWLTQGSVVGVNYQHGINLAEAIDPGSSQRMTVLELIALPAKMSDEAVTDEQELFIAATRIAPILEWAKANGIVPEKADVTSDEMSKAVAAFEQHQVNAEKALQNLTSAPVKLKDYYTGTQMVIPLKSSVISTGVPAAPYPVAQYDALKFKADFNADLQVKKDAYGTIIKSMLATLPLDDRKAIEYGKVQLYSLSIETGKSELLLRDSFIIEAAYEGRTTFYEVNPVLGIMRRRDDFNAVFGGTSFITGNYAADGTVLPSLVVRDQKTVSSELTSNIKDKKSGNNPPPIHFSNVILKPVGDGLPAASPSAANASVVPQTLSSQRSDAIAQTVSEKLFYIDDQALLDAAMEDPERVTQAQKDDQKDYVDNKESREHRRDMLKGFVPLYKPIENIVNGGDRVAGMGEVLLDGVLFFLPIGKFFSGSIRVLGQFGKPFIQRAFPKLGMSLKQLVSPLTKNTEFRAPASGRGENVTKMDASTFKSVNAGKEQFKVNAIAVAKNGTGVREIELKGKTYFAAAKPDAGDGEHYLLRVQDTKDPAKLVSSSIIAKPDAAGVWQRRGIVGGGPVFSKQSSISKDITSQEMQKIVVDTQSIIYVGGEKGFVYTGFAFRGDMRSLETVFKEGFKLRTPVNDINEVNGFRGGFGGGHDALDPDGKGISTSAFYNRDGAGAYHYGGGKGGNTYVIDGRELEGYHLYANRNLQEHPGKNAIKFQPWEINYGTNIPSSYVVGAFDKNGKFISNPQYNRKI